MGRSRSVRASVCACTSVVELRVADTTGNKMHKLVCIRSLDNLALIFHSGQKRDPA